VSPWAGAAEYDARPLLAWAVEWHSVNVLDGDRRHLVWDPHDRFHLFPTRRECRAYIEREFGYIREREDLRREPHGWRIPRAVRVTVSR